MTVRERLIACALSVAILGAVLFIVAYALGGNRLYEGLSVALSAAGLCATATGWAFWILPPETVIDRRDDVPSAEPARTTEAEEVERGTAQLTRRKSLTRLVYVAFGVVAIALVVPVRSLGIASFSQIFAPTKWRKGERLTREDGSPVRVDDINVDSFLTVFPESAPQDPVSQTMLVRVPE